MANTCEIRVGRLMEIRVGDGYRSVRDVDRMIAMMQTHMSSMGPGDRFVIAADWRSVRMMGPDTAARAREMLARSNPRVLRSSILCSPEQSLANLQVVRLIREAEGASRRHFHTAEEQYGWLAEVLTQPERARLAEFLSVALPGASSSDRPPSDRLEGQSRDPRSEPQSSVRLDRGTGGPRSSARQDGGSGGPRSAERPRAVEPPRSGRSSIWPSLLDPGRRTTRPGGSEL